MARQVMEDTISLFYVSERGLTRKQKEFREAFWRYHGAREAIRSAGFGNKSHPHLPAADAKLEPFEQYFAEPETREMLNSIKRERLSLSDSVCLYQLHFSASFVLTINQIC
jgi:hypothetical protein